MIFKSLPIIFDRVGRNVAAGMTGGLAYILDEDNTLLPKVCAFLLHWFMGITMQLENCLVAFCLLILFYFLSSSSIFILIYCACTEPVIQYW